MLKIVNFWRKIASFYQLSEWNENNQYVLQLFFILALFLLYFSCSFCSFVLSIFSILFFSTLFSIPCSVFSHFVFFSNLLCNSCGSLLVSLKVFSPAHKSCWLSRLLLYVSDFFFHSFFLFFFNLEFKKTFFVSSSCSLLCSFLL